MDKITQVYHCKQSKTGNKMSCKILSFIFQPILRQRTSNVGRKLDVDLIRKERGNVNARRGLLEIHTVKRDVQVSQNIVKYGK